MMVGFLSDLIEPAVCLCGAAWWTKQNRVLLRVASATKTLGIAPRGRGGFRGVPYCEREGARNSKI
jgi:hypothetical protein